MTRFDVSWQTGLAAIAALLALVMLRAAGGGAAMAGTGYGLAAVALLVAGALAASLRLGSALSALVLFVAAHGTAWLLLTGITGGEGTAGISFFLMLVAAWLLAWQLVTVLSAMRPSSIS